MRIILNESRRRRGQAGVTLIEALVSMGIFGVGFFSLYAGISMGFAVIGNARENLRATQIMIEKMETIRLYSWDQINTPGFIPATFTESYYPAGSSGSSGGTTTQSNPSAGVVYVGRVTVGNGPSGQSYSSDLRRATLDVTWTSHGKTHSRSMSTYVSRHGLQNYIY